MSRFIKIPIPGSKQVRINADYVVVLEDADSWGVSDARTCIILKHGRRMYTTLEIDRVELLLSLGTAHSGEIGYEPCGSDNVVRISPEFIKCRECHLIFRT